MLNRLYTSYSGHESLAARAIAQRAGRCSFLLKFAEVHLYALHCLHCKLICAAWQDVLNIWLLQATVSPGGGGGKAGHADANRVLEQKQVCPAGKKFGIVACLHGAGKAVRLDRCRTAIEATQQWNDCHEIALDSKLHKGDVVFVMELPARKVDGVTLILKPSVRVTRYRECKPKLHHEKLYAFNTFKSPSAYRLKECAVSVMLPSSAFEKQVL